MLLEFNSLVKKKSLVQYTFLKLYSYFDSPTHGTKGFALEDVGMS